MGSFLAIMVFGFVIMVHFLTENEDISQSGKNLKNYCAMCGFTVLEAKLLYHMTKNPCHIALGPILSSMTFLKHHFK